MTDDIRHMTAITDNISQATNLIIATRKEMQAINMPTDIMLPLMLQMDTVASVIQLKIDSMIEQLEAHDENSQ